MKVCTKCGVEKDEGEFYRKKNGDLQGECKECFRAKMKEYRADHPEKLKAQRKEWYEKKKPPKPDPLAPRTCVKCGEEKPADQFIGVKGSVCLGCRVEKNKQNMREYRAKHPDRIAKYSKKSYVKHREKRREGARDRWARDKDKISATYSEYLKKVMADPERATAYRERMKRNRERYKRDPEVREKWNQRYRERWATDPEFRLAKLLRRRLWEVLKSQGTIKVKTTIALLGCTVEEFKVHIEAQFTEGMTWEEFGVHGIHLDHIRPVASFDLTDPEQQKACFHYTNLQPLWAKDNIRKGVKYEESSCPPLQNGVCNPDIDEDRETES